MIEWVMDASAVLAAFRGEPGGDVAHRALSGSMIGSVNLTEVVTRLIDSGSPPAEAEALVSDAPMTVADFDRSLALRAGALRAATRHRGLSLGDRACLALGEREGLPVLTADRAWEGLDIGVEIRLIR
ncbi:MAG: type II toxin-antitoxin system VapC family toxin [Caulobacteraceae bacterium]